MVSHELGGKTFRPHHHAIVFGYSPYDQKYLKSTGTGERLFTSESLQKLWPHGFHSIGTANERTAFYIAAYALKGKKHDVVLNDGSIEQISDCFDCSKRPGIGLNYLKQPYKTLIHSGEPLPRYYRKKLEKIDPDYLARYENNLMLSSSVRTSHEFLAKFKINEAKLNLSESEFRLDTRDPGKQEFLLKRLKDNIVPDYS